MACGARGARSACLLWVHAAHAGMWGWHGVGDDSMEAVTEEGAVKEGSVHSGGSGGSFSFPMPAPQASAQHAQKHPDGPSPGEQVAHHRMSKGTHRCRPGEAPASGAPGCERAGLACPCRGGCQLFDQ